LNVGPNWKAGGFSYIEWFYHFQERSYLSQGNDIHMLSYTKFQYN